MIVWANRGSRCRSLESRRARAIARASPVRSDRASRYAAVDLSAFHELPDGARRRPSTRGLSGRARRRGSRGADVEQAWWKALAEAFAARSAGAKLALLDAEPAIRASRLSVASFDDHILLSTPTTNARGATTFLDASDDRTPAELDPRRSRAAARPALGRCTLRSGRGCGLVAPTPSTSPRPTSRELGLTVTRVVAPELCALDVPHAPGFSAAAGSTKRRPRLGLCARTARRGRPQPRPAPVPMTRSPAPTAQFASLVYGARGVARRSRRGASTRRRGSIRAWRRNGSTRCVELARGPRAARRRRALEPYARRTARDRAAAAAAACRGSLGDAFARRRSGSAEALRPLAARRARDAARAPRTPREQRSDGAPAAGPVGRRALSARALRRRARGRRARARRLPLQPVPTSGSRRLGPSRWPSVRAALVDPRSSIDAAAVIVVVTAVFWRSRFKYGAARLPVRAARGGPRRPERGARRDGLDLPALPLGGFYDRRLDAARRSRRARRGDGARARRSVEPSDRLLHGRRSRLATGRLRLVVLLLARSPAAAGAHGCPWPAATRGRRARRRCALRSSSRGAGPAGPAERPSLAVASCALIGARCGRERGDPLAAGRARRAASRRAPRRPGRAARSVSRSPTVRGRGSIWQPVRPSAASISRPEPSSRASPRTGPTTLCSLSVLGPSGAAGLGASP